MNKIQQALPPEKYGKRIFGSSLTGKRVKKESALTASEGGATKPSQEKPFDGMNNVVANMLLNMTGHVCKSVDFIFPLRMMGQDGSVELYRFLV